MQAISRVSPRDRNEWPYIGPTYIPHALAVTKTSKDPFAEGLCFRIGQYFLDAGSLMMLKCDFVDVLPSGRTAKSITGIINVTGDLHFWR